MSKPTHLLPRALLSLGEVAALFDCSVDTVTRWVDIGRLQCVKSEWSKEAKFDRREVDRMLRQKFAGAEQLAARRQLVRLACGELTCSGRRLVETGMEGGPEARLCDDELLSIVARAEKELHPAKCTRAEFDSWASERYPSSAATTRRLGLFTWSRVRAHATPPVRSDGLVP